MIQITNQASPYWDSLVTIYHESFPIEEQRPVGEIVRLLSEDTRYVMYALLDTEVVEAIRVVIKKGESKNGEN